MSLWGALARPRRTLRAFERERPSFSGLPFGAWAGLTAIAVGGSAVYGASLARVLPGWRPREGALWLALSAGAGWCVFGPGLIRVSGKHPFVCAQACMATMAYGEGVLVTGAALNALLADRRRLPRLDRARFNLGWVGLSNVVMAAALAAQMRAIGVPAWKTLATWMVLLNGSGAGFFWALARVLRRSRES
jgi:hypothetical protein